MPRATAATVVTTKNAMTRHPALLRNAGSPLDVMPITMDDSTSTTTTIWMSARNSLPGSATHAAMESAVPVDTRPAPLGDNSNPTATPRTMPTRTCAHRRVRIHRPSLGASCSVSRITEARGCRSAVSLMRRLVRSMASEEQNYGRRADGARREVPDIFFLPTTFPRSPHV